VNVGDKVIWTGVHDPRCAPGFNGKVEKIASKDSNSIRVFWDERGSYTWERRKNLSVADGAGNASANGQAGG
jgi:hypothetical protein